MYVERPLSLAEKKQFYLDFALLNNEQSDRPPERDFRAEPGR